MILPQTNEPAVLGVPAVPAPAHFSLPGSHNALPACGSCFSGASVAVCLLSKRSSPTPAVQFSKWPEEGQISPVLPQLHTFFCTPANPITMDPHVSLPAPTVPHCPQSQLFQSALGPISKTSCTQSLFQPYTLPARFPSHDANSPTFSPHNSLPHVLWHQNDFPGHLS